MSLKVAREEVLLFVARTGATPAEAAEHFFPGDDPERRRKRTDQFRKWVSRHGAKYGLGGAPAPAPATSGATSSGTSTQAAPVPKEDVAQMDAASRLEWLVARLAAGVELSLQRSDARGMASVAAAMVAAGKELDDAKDRQSSITGLERTPAGLSLALDQTAKARERLRRHRAAVAARERQL